MEILILAEAPDRKQRPLSVDCEWDACVRFGASASVPAEQGVPAGPMLVAQISYHATA